MIAGKASSLTNSAFQYRLILYLSVEEVTILHADVLGASHDLAEHYLLNRDRLESALARPMQAARYEDADLVRQASTLLWGLIQDHAFIDGNKRAAWVVTRNFLLLNAWTVGATPDERLDLVTGIAEGRYDVDYTNEWFRRHAFEIPPRYRRFRR